MYLYLQYFESTDSNYNNTVSTVSNDSGDKLDEFEKILADDIKSSGLPYKIEDGVFIQDIRFNRDSNAIFYDIEVSKKFGKSKTKEEALAKLEKLYQSDELHTLSCNGWKDNAALSPNIVMIIKYKFTYYGEYLIQSFDKTNCL